MHAVSQTQFSPSIDVGKTSAAGFIQSSSTVDPTSLFEEVRRDNVIVVDTIEEPMVFQYSKIEEFEVTHKRFFGENIKRIIHTLLDR